MIPSIENALGEIAKMLLSPFAGKTIKLHSKPITPYQLLMDYGVATTEES